MEIGRTTTTNGEIAEVRHNDLLNSVIDYVVFCIEPLEDVLFRLAIYIGSLLPTQWVGRTVPSPHHRCIVFRAKRIDLVFMRQYYIWGIMEFHTAGAKCYLYTNVDIPGRRLRMYSHLSGRPTTRYTIRELFTAAWEGEYHAMTNNCIDYAIRCWNLLSPEYTMIEWDDVCRY